MHYAVGGKPTKVRCIFWPYIVFFCVKSEQISPTLLYFLLYVITLASQIVDHQTTQKPSSQHKEQKVKGMAHSPLFHSQSSHGLALLIIWANKILYTMVSRVSVATHANVKWNYSVAIYLINYGYFDVKIAKILFSCDFTLDSAIFIKIAA